MDLAPGDGSVLARILLSPNVLPFCGGTLETLQSISPLPGAVGSSQLA
jgi:hypothetical protein